MVNILIEIIALTNMHLIFLFLVPMVLIQLMQLKKAQVIFMKYHLLECQMKKLSLKIKPFQNLLRGLPNV